MPYVTDVRRSNSLIVFEVNNRLYIDGMEHSMTNLAPIAFSQGPTAWPQSANTTLGRFPHAPLSLSRFYTRGYNNLYPFTSAEGEAYDTTRAACGQNVLGQVVYSSSQERFYVWGTAGTSANNTVAAFDPSFRTISNNVASLGSTYGYSSFFLPPQNNRWLAICSHSYEYGAANTNGYTGPYVGTLQTNGVGTGIVSQGWWFQLCLPYIGTDWVWGVSSPWQAFDAGETDTYLGTYMSLYNRNTGALTDLGLWLARPSALFTGFSRFATIGCTPSNFIRTSSNEMYCYLPILDGGLEASTGLPEFRVAIATLNNLASTPSRTPFSTAYTISAVDTTADTITTSADIPNLSVVRFTATGTGASVPSPLVVDRDYWTIRQSANISKIASTYQNAVDGYAIDLTSAGAGTRTATAFELLTLDANSASSGGSAVTPRNTQAGTIVRSWVFENGGTNYLCVGVSEMGTRAVLTSDVMNLYLWRLDSKRKATFLQKISAGTAGRPRSFFTLDEQQKRIAIIYDDRIMFYQWNPSTNWTFQSNQDIQVQDVGVDTLGRVWVTNRGTYAGPMTGLPANTQQLYVFEPSGAAANIVVTFAQNAYTYSGSTVSSNIIVNAYDTTGARVALGVTITRDSSNFSFSGGASSVSVTTSATADTLVPISIFSTGLLSAIAVPGT